MGAYLQIRATCGKKYRLLVKVLIFTGQYADIILKSILNGVDVMNPISMLDIANRNGDTSNAKARGASGTDFSDALKICASNANCEHIDNDTAKEKCGDVDSLFSAMGEQFIKNYKEFVDKKDQRDYDDYLDSLLELTKKDGITTEQMIQLLAKAGQL